MRRLLAIMVLVPALLAVGLAAPAHAKGPDRAQVSGPGLDGVWVLPTRRHESPRPGVDAWTLMEASNLFQIWGAARGGERPALTEERLGPAYVLTWYVQDFRVTETVAYPFAEGGAWVTTTEGMEDWIRVGGRLRRLLMRLGAVRGDADAAPASLTAPPATDAAATLSALVAVVAWWLRP